MDDNWQIIKLNLGLKTSEDYDWAKADKDNTLPYDTKAVNIHESMRIKHSQQAYSNQLDFWEENNMHKKWQKDENRYILGTSAVHGTYKGLIVFS